MSDISLSYYEAGALVTRCFNWQELHMQVHNIALDGKDNPEGRDFQFSVMEHPSLRNEYLITLRSSTPFPGSLSAAKRHLSVSPNQPITIRIEMSLQVSKGSPKGEKKPSGNRIIQPYEMNDWITGVLVRRGLNVSSVSWSTPTKRRVIKNSGTRFFIPSAQFCITGTIKEPQAFIDAVKNGIGRNKAYGFGMIEVIG